ncbi:MAG: Lrp/AsnC ligand binding domain-containing protein [Saprospiraceae bacterium]|nr:Lrp/AsnC ligand binding domain-containing protein [Saprospiraceae bacterium]
MVEKTDSIDDLDKNILSSIMQGQGLSYAELGKKLFVSPGTIHVRIKKMQGLGIIKREFVEVDYHKLGYDVTAFLGIYLDKSSMYDDVLNKLKAIPEVVEAHYTTGNYSIFVKLICKDTKHLKLILTDHIQSISGVQRTETLISLQESISRPLIL